MKINFTAFNTGQEDFVFDTKILKDGEKLEKFLLNKNENGKIYIVPMIVKDKYYRYPYDVLEKI
jgi:hypothetical protein